MRKAVLKNFAIFTGTLQACNFIKNRLQHLCFPLNIAKFLKHLFRRTSANGCFRFVDPIQNGLFRGCLRMGGGFLAPKICRTYPTMMTLGTVIPYLRQIQKIYKSRDTPLSSADISIFSQEIRKFCYIKKYRYRLAFDTQFLIRLTYFESLIIVVINVVTIWIMSAKMATPGFLEIEVF